MVCTNTLGYIHTPRVHFKNHNIPCIMKNLLNFFLVLFISQIGISQSVETPKAHESSKSEKWRSGLTLGYLKYGGTTNAYQIGLSTEYFWRKRLSLDLELNSELQLTDWGIIGIEDNEKINLELAISPKYYFGRKKRFFGKAGIYLSQDLYSKLSEAELGSTANNRTRLRLQMGLGYNLHLDNGHTIKIEGLIRSPYGTEKPVMGIRLGWMF